MQYRLTLLELCDTEMLACKIAQILPTNFVITLNGDLGVGKTTLAREILRAFGVVGSIKSPTFTLVEPYKAQDISFFHFDLYRFCSAEEWFDLGFDEYFCGDKFICLIEWAEKASSLIPNIDWQINIQLQSDGARELIINSLTSIGEECLNKLTQSDEN